MRRGPAAPLRLFNGADGEWLARIATMKRGSAALTVERRLRPQAAEPDLWLAFALLKRDATDFVAQKATELGVSALLPVTTERTNAERVNVARLTAIATEAAEQSERLSVPRIAPRPAPARSARRVAARADARSPQSSGRTRRRSAPAGVQPRPRCWWDRRGVSPSRELDALRARPFVVPVSLGPRVLRAETASIAGLALLQAVRIDDRKRREAGSPMSNPGDADATPITSMRQLADYIAAGCKPPEAFRIGTEHEKFGFRLTDLAPPPYEPRGIEALLEGMAAAGGEPILDHGRIIGLQAGCRVDLARTGGAARIVRARRSPRCTRRAPSSRRISARCAPSLAGSAWASPRSVSTRPRPAPRCPGCPRAVTR